MTLLVSSRLVSHENFNSIVLLRLSTVWSSGLAGFSMMLNIKNKLQTARSAILFVFHDQGLHIVEEAAG